MTLKRDADPESAVVAEKGSTAKITSLLVDTHPHSLVNEVEADFVQSFCKNLSGDKEGDLGLEILNMSLTEFAFSDKKLHDELAQRSVQASHMLAEKQTAEARQQITGIEANTAANKAMTEAQAKADADALIAMKKAEVERSLAEKKAQMENQLKLQAAEAEGERVRIEVDVAKQKNQSTIMMESEKIKAEADAKLYAAEKEAQAKKISAQAQNEAQNLYIEQLNSSTNFFKLKEIEAQGNAMQAGLSKVSKGFIALDPAVGKSLWSANGFGLLRDLAPLTINQDASIENVKVINHSK